MFFARQASIRFICSLFSLPVPPENPHGPKEDPSTFSGKSVPEYLDQGRVQKLLLFGLEGSGTSTIFKQVCCINSTVFWSASKCGLFQFHISDVDILSSPHKV